MYFAGVSLDFPDKTIVFGVSGIGSRYGEREVLNTSIVKKSKTHKSLVFLCLFVLPLCFWIVEKVFVKGMKNKSIS